MTSPMNRRQWARFETAIRQFCELRAEYQAQKSSGQLSSVRDESYQSDLERLETSIERMRDGVEPAQEWPKPRLVVVARAS